MFILPFYFVLPYIFITTMLYLKNLGNLILKISVWLIPRSENKLQKQKKKKVGSNLLESIAVTS